MAYCGPKGIPLDKFLTWPEESQQAALAWQAHEGRRCPSCGTHPDDFPDGGRGPNHVHFHESVCIGCQKAAIAEDGLGEHRPGVRITAASGPASDCGICSHTP